jgi:hypothetical protein
LLHQAALWVRGEHVASDSELRPGDGRVTEAVAEGWRGILLRRPRWRAEAEFRAEYEVNHFPDERVRALGSAEPGRVAIDLAVVDARPSGDSDALLAIEPRGDGRLRLTEALVRLPAYALIARRYRHL